MKNKIPVCKISNQFLKTALADLVKSNGYPIDKRYWNYEHPEYKYFTLNDDLDQGAGFTTIDLSFHNGNKYKLIFLEEMFDIVSEPKFIPISVKLDDDCIAEILKDGSVKFAGHTFSADAITNLYNNIQSVLSKKNNI